MRVLQLAAFRIHESAQEKIAKDREKESESESEDKKSGIDFFFHRCVRMLICSRRCFQYINRLCWINTMIVRALHTLDR